MSKQQVVAEMSSNKFYNTMIVDGNIAPTPEQEMPLQLLLSTMPKAENARTALTLTSFVNALVEQGTINAGQAAWLLAQSVGVMKAALGNFFTADFIIPSAQMDGATGVQHTAINLLAYANGGSNPRARVKAFLTVAGEGEERARWSVGDFMIGKKSHWGHGSLLGLDLVELGAKVTIVKGTYTDSKTHQEREKDDAAVYAVPGSGSSAAFEVTVTYSTPSWNDVTIIVTG